MRTTELFNKLKGMQTIESVMSILGINKNKTIYYIHRLKKLGYIKTKYKSDKKRIYFISKENTLNQMSYSDILNKYSPVKIYDSEVYKIHGRNIGIEEAIVYAIKTGKFRYVLSSIFLFRKKIKWKVIYEYAKKDNLLRQVGALYDLSRIILNKVRKIDNRFKIKMLPKKSDKYKYIINNLKSKDFKNIEEIWKVYIPFNKGDFEEFK